MDYKKSSTTGAVCRHWLVNLEPTESSPYASTQLQPSSACYLDERSTCWIYIGPTSAQCSSSSSASSMVASTARNEYGCVWIKLIFAENKIWNWKHCSEIIFKYVNSTVGPIFNKKVAEKCNFWDREQCTDALFTVDKVNYCGWTKKKKKTQFWKRRRKNKCNPNGHYIWNS